MFPTNHLISVDIPVKIPAPDRGRRRTKGDNNHKFYQDDSGWRQQQVFQGSSREAENSSIRRLSRDHGYTLYVENIPQAMQWKGL
ncbi:hypothetical protein V6N13_053772 [Hibiscus sabdariffa]